MSSSSSSDDEHQSCVPVAPAQMEAQAEDQLLDSIDTLICTFLSQPGRRYPYRSTFQCTCDDEPNMSYNFIVLIERPARLCR
jgi:hypothetical protein